MHGFARRADRRAEVGVGAAELGALQFTQVADRDVGTRGDPRGEPRAGGRDADQQRNHHKQAFGEINQHNEMCSVNGS